MTTAGSVQSFKSTEKSASRYRWWSQLKIESEDQPGLMALKIDKIERGCGPGWPAPDLRTPGQRQSRFLRQLPIRSWADEQRLPSKTVESRTVISSKVSRFPTDQETRLDLRHHRKRGSARRLLIGYCAPEEMSRFRFVKQIEGRHDTVSNQLAFDGERQFGGVISRSRAADIVELPGPAFQRERHAEGRRLPVKKLVAQIERAALPIQLAAIVETGYGADIVI